MKRYFYKFFILSILISCIGCKAFMEGYTWRKTENSYNLITGNKNNFGDRRLEYIKANRTHSTLANFLDCRCNDRGLPDFIYEYELDKKSNGIKFFYVKLDSVFIFKLPKKLSAKTIQIEARGMNDSERFAYESLKVKK